MPTKPRTKKPATKPQRKPRTISEKPIDVLARNLADTIGRKLDGLLAQRAAENGQTLRFSEERGGLDELVRNPSFDAISARTVEKLSDGVTGYRANYATEPAPSRISPVEEALRRLRDEISMAELSTDMSTERLDSILGPPTPTAGGTDAAAPIRMSGELASLLNGLADRLSRDNARRTHLLDRLEL